MAVLLKPLPCRYHSLIEFKVLFLVRSNMNNMATASLHTRGSMLTNSRWPPRSHMEKVISVFRIEIVFSMKLTPRNSASGRLSLGFRVFTKGLNVVLIPTTFNVFDHQARLSNLRITHHAHFDHHTTLCLLPSMPLPLILLLICLRVAIAGQSR